MEWNAVLKAQNKELEGAPFIRRHIIEATTKAFDDFAGGDIDQAHLKNSKHLN